MSKVNPPPITDDLADKEGKATIPWTLFFNSVWTGDTGTTWNPVFTDLTTVGTPTVTGRYYKISQKLVYFSILIVPGTSTTSVAGTTYVGNLPFTLNGNSANFAIGGAGGTGPGINDGATNRIYTPAWSAVTNSITIVGIGEIR